MRRRLLAIVMALLLAFPLFSRPKVALVLGGGGAKGFSEIAVLEAVEAYGIPVDMVLGTSMGALIGAMYCSGYTPKEIDEFASSNDLMSIVLEPSRERPFPMPEVFSPRKDNLISLGFNRHRIGSTPGLLGDSRLLDWLERIYGKQDGVKDFDDLPIPFRAVATDAVSGERIVYDHGSLVDAVRSSISIPVIFAPYPQPDGSLAMDGGLVDNLPVDLARSLGADYVIAVDVNGHKSRPEQEIQSVTDAALQFATLVTWSSAKRQYDNADLLILPNMAGYGTMSFGDYEEIVALGREACEEMAPEFQAFADMLKSQGASTSYDPDREGAYRRTPPRVVSAVEIEDRSPVTKKARLKEKDFSRFVGKELDDAMRSKLATYLLRLRSTYQYASLSYNTDYLDDGTCKVVVRSFSFPVRQHRFTIGGTPTAGISNNSPGQYTWVSLSMKEQLDFTQLGPIEHLKVWTSQGQTSDFGLSVMLPFVSVNSHVFGLEAKGIWSMGSFELGSNVHYGNRRAALDMGAMRNMSFLYDYADLINLRVGNQFQWVNIHHWESSFWLRTAYTSLVVDTMHKLSLVQNGVRGDVRYQFEVKEGNKKGFSLQASFRQDVAMHGDQQMLGYQFDFHWMRLCEGLNQSYVDIGGVNGLPGYSCSTLRQDVLGGYLRYRLQIATVLGCPVYWMAKIGALVFSDKDPFDGEFVSGRYFGGDLYWDIGAGSAFAITTPLGSFFAGFGVAAHSGGYDLMVGVVV